jgi:hypothetical protein
VRDLFGPNSIQMPPLDSTVVDTQAVDVVTQWILGMSNMFWVGAAPDPQTVMPGHDAHYTVTVLPTADFSSAVTLSVAGGLPPGAVPAFVPPSVTGSNTSALTITTTGATPQGSYELTLAGIGGGVTNTSTLTLIISSNTPPIPGTLLWTGASGSDINWSTSLNWNNVTAATNNPPGPDNDVIFTNTAAVSTPGQVNNVVDSATTIHSLWYGISPAGLPNNHHTTLINPGVTLSVTGAVSLPSINGVTVTRGVLVGYNANIGNPGTFPTTDATIEGSGILSVNNPSADFFVAQFSTQSNHPSGAATRAVLDMSGLDVFTASVSRLLVGCWANGSSGILYLAKTNSITVSGGSATPGGTSFTGIDVANNNSNAGEPSYLYLGRTNAIYVNTVRAGAAKGYFGVIAFNPAFTNSNPVARFRGTGGDNSRVAAWIVSDLSDASGTANVTNPKGTNDFTGGTVDILADALVVGKTTAHASGSPGTGYTSNRVSTGTVTFNAGIIDVNYLTNGWQVGNINGGANSTDTGIGTVNVNGTGRLVVNQDLILASGSYDFPVGGNGASTTSYAQGTLNVAGGTVLANRITGGGGRSTMVLNNGTLVLTNTAGAPGSAIANLILNGSTLRLRANAAAIVTNLVATNLTAGGVTIIDLDTVQNVTGPVTFPLVSYAAFSGSVAANFALGALPSGFKAALVDNPAQQRIDLSIAPSTAVTPHIGSIALSGAGVVVDGTNGLPNGNYYVLESSNIALPLSNWTSVGTNLFDGSGHFRFTNGVDPGLPQRFYILQLP